MLDLTKLLIFLGAMAWTVGVWGETNSLDDGIAAYQQGNGKTALAHLQPLARQGDAEAQYYLGRLYYYDNTGVPQSYRTAARWFERSARQGHAAAQYKIGGMYFSGRGVAQNDRLTVKWWRLAAAQNHGETQNNLGALFANGRGVPRNLVMAYAMQMLAQENGAESAAENLRAKEAAMSATELEAAQALAGEMRQSGGVARILTQHLDNKVR